MYKKILIVSHAAGTPDIGPNMRTYFLAKKLVERGYEVNIVGSGNFHKYSHSPLVEKKYTQAKICGISYHWLPTISYRHKGIRQVLNQLHFVLRLFLFWPNLKLMKPELILFSSPPPVAIFFIGLFKKNSKAKLIFEVRDLWPQIISELGNFKSFHPYIQLIRMSVSLSYKIADAIVSVKPGDLNYISKNYSTQKNLNYIPNGFDHLSLMKTNFEHPVFNNDDFKIVYTGALSSYYSIQHLLFVAKELVDLNPHIRIILVGDGENMKEFQDYKNSQNLSNVYFLGHIEKRYMLSILKQADVAFIGLRNVKANLLGISTNKIFEYMYAEKPIIGSYNTNYDIIKDAKCGISVQSESIYEIKKAIVQMSKMNKEELKEIGNNGKKYLLNHHTFEKITDKYIELFNSL